MKRMLFNATQQEELRVAIVDGQKLIDIDIETAGREQRKSNIYKGVITRIEPSLEACFVSYGEDRHGFLPFKEVARSYFREGVDVRNASVKEALREGQEIMVQVEKEERGNKGAALTSFISLAGRYLVLMPNNPRGGGVSRRVEGEERQELRETMDKLDLPQGMSVIARTAGIGRTVEELQWDLNYLMQLWRAIEGASKAASGAFLIYQESSLVIRAIRDYFQPDIGEILIDTDEIYEQAHQFMSHVMPDMVHRVKRYSDDVPLFSRFQIEHQIETAYSRTVPLPSGGAIVIDHTEALVSIDVNSARATRGSDIETTAFHTNCEAADEVARQLRLRDLGGLIVIDFIDMEVSKNQREVEQRLKDALHHDRARVQMGKISRFGLMELSRQRLRPSLSEGSHVTCPRCSGTGHIRDTESSALQVLRIIQEEAMKENSAAIHVQVPVDVAAFLLNEKRGEVLKIETRHRITVILIPNKHLETPHYKLERIKHDDPRLEDHAASYTMAEAAETDMSFSKRHKEEAKPRQEAVVKTITPEQPAPMVEHKPEAAKPAAAAPRAAAPAAPAEKGFFAKLISFFTGGEKEEPVQPKAPVIVTKAPANAERGDRKDRGQRGRNRGGKGGRGEREDREPGTRPGAEEAKPAAEARKPREQREPREPREPRQPREPREQREGAEAAQAQGQRAEREPREQREPREPRQPRQPREPRAEKAVPAEAKAEELALAAAGVGPVGTGTGAPETPVLVKAASNTGPEGEEHEGAEGGDEPRRRRRRGGRNRNRREREGAEGVEGAEGATEATFTVAPAEGEAVPVAAATEAVSAPVAAPAAVTAEQASTEAASAAAAEGAAAHAAAATAVEAPALAEPVAVAPVVAAPVEPAPVAVAPVEPAAVDLPVAAPAAAEPVAAEPVVSAPASPQGVLPFAEAAPAATEPATAEEVAADVVEPAAAATPAPAEAAAVAAAPAPAPVAPAPAPAPAAPVPAAAKADVDAMLAAAGLSMAVTDPAKVRAAQEAAAAAATTQPIRVPRERKPLPPVASEPLVQVETKANG
ncbi:Rne/Rng family ribonuclease [Pseudoduganella sp. R-34]|uniref:Rne/Rng family ribonuclease n=1 Tax=Pseudoduganella sp. R-34 TaxID=3404062 RepID=UPI003CF922A0